MKCFAKKFLSSLLAAALCFSLPGCAKITDLLPDDDNKSSVFSGNSIKTESSSPDLLQAEVISSDSEESDYISEDIISSEISSGDIDSSDDISTDSTEQTNSYYNSELRAYTAGTASDSSVYLTWKEAGQAAYYTLERRMKNQDGWETFTTLSDKLTSTEYTDTAARVNECYEYRVTTVDWQGNSQSLSIRLMDKQPHVLVLDSSGRTDPKRVSKYLENAGFVVEFVKDDIKVNTRDDVLAENYDALVIPGGYSVNPSCYGDTIQNSHSKYGSLSNDKNQIDAVLKFKDAGKAVLGICRGCQIINVAFGGTLTQCIGADHTHYHGKYRNVAIKENSFLYGLLGINAETLHSHHQAIKTLGQDLIETEWDSDDDTIEAIESTTSPIFGLQWHPDDYKSTDGKKRKDELGLSVFREFRSVCQTLMAE